MDIEREQFIAQKNAIREQILLKMETMRTNMNLLTTNIQTLNSIGQHFEETSQLWSSYHQTLRTNAGGDHSYTGEDQTGTDHQR